MVLHSYVPDHRHGFSAELIGGRLGGNAEKLLVCDSNEDTLDDDALKN